eukprot:14838039-Alexandrium_andersonii.AAC.1
MHKKGGLQIQFVESAELLACYVRRNQPALIQQCEDALPLRACWTAAACCNRLQRTSGGGSRMQLTSGTGACGFRVP